MRKIIRRKSSEEALRLWLALRDASAARLAEVERRLAELPRDREVVAYCRGPFCAYAHEAVRRLNEAGRGDRLLRGRRLLPRPGGDRPRRGRARPRQRVGDRFLPRGARKYGVTSISLLARRRGA